MNWLDGEHTCIHIYSISISIRASLYQLVHFYCPPPHRSLPAPLLSLAGKLFFNYFLCTQVNGLMSLSHLVSSHPIVMQQQQMLPHATCHEELRFKISSPSTNYSCFNENSFQVMLAGWGEAERGLPKINVPFDKLSICHTPIERERVSRKPINHSLSLSKSKIQNAKANLFLGDHFHELWYFL